MVVIRHDLVRLKKVFVCIYFFHVWGILKHKTKLSNLLLSLVFQIPSQKWKQRIFNWNYLRSNLRAFDAPQIWQDMKFHQKDFIYCKHVLNTCTSPTIARLSTSHALGKSYLLDCFTHTISKIQIVTARLLHFLLTRILRPIHDVNTATRLFLSLFGICCKICYW